jgi:hypothetical protein
MTPFDLFPGLQVNAGFFNQDGQLLHDAHKLKNIPGVIVQGRYDVVCPAMSAVRLLSTLCTVHSTLTFPLFCYLFPVGFAQGLAPV